MNFKRALAIGLVGLLGILCDVAPAQDVRIYPDIIGLWTNVYRIDQERVADNAAQAGTNAYFQGAIVGNHAYSVQWNADSIARDTAISNWAAIHFAINTYYSSNANALAWSQFPATQMVAYNAGFSITTSSNSTTTTTTNTTIDSITTNSVIVTNMVATTNAVMTVQTNTITANSYNGWSPAQHQENVGEAGESIVGTTWYQFQNLQCVVPISYSRRGGMLYAFVFPYSTYGEKTFSQYGTLQGVSVTVNQSWTPVRDSFTIATYTRLVGPIGNSLWQREDNSMAPSYGGVNDLWGTSSSSWDNQRLVDLQIQYAPADIAITYSDIIVYTINSIQVSLAFASNLTSYVITTNPVYTVGTTYTTNYLSTTNTVTNWTYTVTNAWDTNACWELGRTGDVFVLRWNGTNMATLSSDGTLWAPSLTNAAVAQAAVNASKLNLSGGIMTGPLTNNILFAGNGVGLTNLPGAEPLWTSASNAVVYTNDLHLTNDRYPTAHNQALATITDAGTMAAEAAADYTKTANLGDLALLDTIPLSAVTNAGTMAAESAGDYTKTANLAAVALSGNYSDLTNKPTLGTMAAESTSGYVGTNAFKGTNDIFRAQIDAANSNITTLEENAMQLYRYAAMSVANEQIEVLATGTNITAARVGTTITTTIPSGVKLISMRLRWDGSLGATFTLKLGTVDMANASATDRWGATFAAYREDTGALIAGASCRLNTTDFDTLEIQGLSTATINHIRLGF